MNIIASVHSFGSIVRGFKILLFNGGCADFGLYNLMEESKRKEIRDYIEAQVNPVIRPLVEEIVRKRPSNIAGFINEYSFRLMSKGLSIQTTRTKPDFSLTPMKIAKRPKQSFCANWRSARRRKLRKSTVVRASVLNASDSSTSRLSSSPR